MFMSKFYFISISMILISLVLMSVVFFFFFFSWSMLLEIELYSFNSVNFNFIFFFDWMSLMFMLVVIFISSLVLIYSKLYLGSECYRFLWLTGFFIIFMLLMILSPSVLGVILGWDGLGLISYCLVIYYQSKDSFNSGFITAASNRMGDSLLLLSVGWYSFSGNFMFWDLNMGVLFLILACMTKSAQFPFSAWLPSAMAAPTPISSLVHSSTLVTAGVYILIRYSFVIEQLHFMSFLTFMSGFTILLAGVSALQEYDLKRVIALSTLGQLGFMIMVLSLGYSYVAFFHLLIHAMFKSLLFLCAGAIIHSGTSIQDLRKMGSFYVELTVKICFYISNFCLMGMPFTSGFYSKDLLLELIYCSYSGIGMGVYMYIMAMITIVYTFRLMLFLSYNNFWVLWVESDKKMVLCLVTLSFFNIIGGSMFNWVLMNNLDFICLPLLVKILPIILLFVSVIMMNLLTLNNLNYYLTELLYISSLTKSVSKLVELMFILVKVLDQGWLEMIMSLSKKLLIINSFWLKNVWGGGVNLYMYSLGVILLLLILL
uniref:NADH-ubiquinone oxidoreductase chain 5 n=1 Tax=Allocarsidara bakeri TaxID=2218082 RepID=A0A344A234_9HEMI|nr:NADH dehydrogenase subunit 5 [Allocarsidara bakeri]